MYIKKISEFIEDTIIDANGITPVVELLRHIYPNSETGEIRSWENSLPCLARILNELPENIKNNCEICLEAQYHSDEKTDVAIIGKKDDRTVIIVIENKQWSNLSEYEPASDRCLRDPWHDSNFVEHPCYQVSHYKYILENTNSYCQNNNTSIYAAIFMHNATENERNSNVGPFSNQFENILQEIPVFVGNNGTSDSIGHNLKEYIENKLDDGENNLAERIYNSERRESNAYRNTIANAFGDEEQLLNLFDENQIAIFEEIKESVLSNQRKIFIVEGDPGTGKTFIAIALLSYLYIHNANNNQRNIKLVLKNKDPRLALIRMGIPEEAITYGLTNDLNNYDCLICDESHRLLEQPWSGRDDRNNIDIIINQSTVPVFFYDNRQRVHVKDYITTEKIEEKAAELEITVVKHELEYQHRCLESDHFMQLIDRILYEPELGLEDIDEFTEDETYLVRMVNSPRELLYKIKQLNDERAEAENGSRVLAGKGRTNEVDWEWEDDDIPLRERKSIGPFRNDDNLYVWNLRNYPKPHSFASVDSSVNLVGCIDTSQGLDFEYIGIIIAPDLVYNDTTGYVDVNIDGHYQDDPNLKMRDYNNNSLHKTIIRNTYHVLASRGKKGCFIYCCDEGLHNYLSNIIPTLTVDVPDDYETYPE